MRGRHVGLGVGVVLGLACLGAPADAAFPGENGLIVFARGITGVDTEDVFVMNGDGTGIPLNLTNLTPQEDENARWSADGTKIVFRSNRDGNEEIYVMDADGKNLVNLTKHQADDASPSWSPDGKQILFSTNRDRNTEVYVMNADGTAPRNLSNCRDCTDDEARWSPDGRTIAFVSNRHDTSSDKADIYVMNADGSNVRDLTPRTGSNEDNPNWSPDSRLLAFDSDRDASTGGAIDIYVMNAADGTGVRRLTSDRAADRRPAWSPDGTKIAFQSNRDGDDEIFVMNASDGGSVRQLTTNDVGDIEPDWGPRATVASPALLRAADLPAGFTLVGNPTSTTGVVTSGKVEPATCKETVQPITGSTGSATARFSRNPSTTDAALVETVITFGSKADAKRAFTERKQNQAARTKCGQVAFTTPAGPVVQLVYSAAKFPKVADASFAGRGAQAGSATGSVAVTFRAGTTLVSVNLPESGANVLSKADAKKVCTVATKVAAKNA